MCFVSFKILMLNGCQSVTFILVKAGKFSKEGTEKVPSWVMLV